jgi:hypothetical protein
MMMVLSDDSRQISLKWQVSFFEIYCFVMIETCRQCSSWTSGDLQESSSLRGDNLSQLKTVSRKA